MTYEPQTESVKFRKTTKQKLTLLKAQYFTSSNDYSDVADELIRNWYEHNPINIDSIHPTSSTASLIPSNSFTDADEVSSSES
jgi:hypothetical protein